MTTAKHQTLVDFVHCSVYRGQFSQSPPGYAPLPPNLTEDALRVIPALHAADPDVDVSNRDISTCDNPTFERGTTPKDRLGATVAHRLTGTLRASGIPVERGIVAIYGAVRGVAWKRIDTVRADSHGALRVSVHPARTSRYQDRFGGTSHVTRATSGTVVVTVR